MTWIASFLAELGHVAAAPWPEGPTLAPAAPVMVAPVLSPVPPAPDGGQVTARLLLRLGARDADAWAGPLGHACAASGIVTAPRLAAFLANILHETSGFSALQESLNYTPDALVRTWPAHFTRASAARLGRTSAHPADQRGIAEAAYGGRMGNGPPGSGEGFAYRGVGLLQLTGKKNMAAFAGKIGWKRPLAELPVLLATKAGAADSAAAFWQAAGCNQAADRGDIGTVRRLVNGGSIGLDDVRARYAAARHALGI